MSRSTDEADYQFMTTAGSHMNIRLRTTAKGRPELQLFGNRAGILSFANILLYLVSNSWRREFLSLGVLPFVHPEGMVSVCLRMTADEPTGKHGSVIRADRGEQLEWVIAEDDLKQVALWVHHLACKPEHEYDLLMMAEESEFEVHVRMTDAADWLGL